MRINLFYFRVGMILAAGATSLRAQDASVASVPNGMISFTLAANSVSYLSLPLSNNVSYTSTVSSVTTNTISVADSPAPFTSSLATSGSPYFIKFLSGNEIGRVLLITANTAASLTLDTTDNSSQNVNLTASGFSVAAGDTFEVFPGSTLSTVFGDNSAQNPVVLKAANNVSSADSISIYNSILGRFFTYYFNATDGHWEIPGSPANANNTILYPYQTVAVTRRAKETAVTIVMSGRVAEVPVLTKAAGNNSIVYGSSGYATDLTLSQLQLGSNWVKATNPSSADTLSVWNGALGRFDTYYQRPDSTWRQAIAASGDMSNFVLTAGTTVAYLQRSNVTGAASFISAELPYSLN